MDTEDPDDSARQPAQAPSRQPKPHGKTRFWLGCGGFLLFFVLVVLFLLPDPGLGLLSRLMPLYTVGPYAPAPMTFDGGSGQLAQMQIVPTLDTPMQTGKNVVWCASFEAAWKELARQVTSGTLQVNGAQALCARLNAAPDPLGYIPKESFYADGGRVDQGPLSRIQETMSRRFPKAPIPEFPGVANDHVVAYAYLETQVPFTIPYFDSRRPLDFTDSAGVITPVRSFGIRLEDGGAYTRLRKQVRLLYVEAPPDHRFPQWARSAEFALDLCRDSKPCQIVSARIEPKETLEATLTSLDGKVRECKLAEDRDYLGWNDTLLVPDMCWRIAHHFAELEGQKVLTPPFTGNPLVAALQTIQFRLDRSGADLRSEAKIMVESAHPPCEFKRPFLLYVKKRDAARPFFVMWVANAELLQRWPVDKKPQEPDAPPPSRP